MICEMKKGGDGFACNEIEFNKIFQSIERDDIEFYWFEDFLDFCEFYVDKNKQHKQQIEQFKKDLKIKGRTRRDQLKPILEYEEAKQKLNKKELEEWLEEEV